ncbi:MAG: Oligopeptide-binding protein AppA [Paracidovorax wautersii]|uniref:Oligopeptide-binding protein AppA n=1 Tax=Paracidovorax wautersii TaxID=1177982 RepID=A0A7V8FRX5_9BURK|nr:MAG: Oligopeptide-binding protein AppA [Paracidovorax wautersii]
MTHRSDATSPASGPAALGRRPFLGALAASALAGLPAAGQAQQPAQPRRGGTLNFLSVPEAATIVSIDNTFGFPQKVGTKVVEGLLSYDFALRPQPSLATAWRVSPDGLQYTFELRRGVKWHDGQPFTSADVAYSLLTLKELHPRGRATFANLAEVRTPDSYTAVLVLGRPAPFLLTALASSESPIVPAHLYRGTDARTNPWNQKPVGTGPFVFKEWVRGSHIILERNPDYWVPGKPYLDRIIVRIITEPAARAAAFEAGQLDLGGDTPVPAADLARLTALPQLASTTQGYEYVGNLSQFEFNLQTPQLAHAKVRRAIAHAVDSTALVKLAWYGYGQPSPTPISPVLKAYHDASIAPHAHDLPLAERLLDEAGYPRGADGRRFALRLIFNPFYYEGNRRTTEYLRQSLQRIGIDATIASHDFGSFVKAAYTDRSFDISVNNLNNNFDPTVGVQRIYWSKNIKAGLGFSNASHYANPEVDRLLEQAAVEPDPARRRELFVQFQRIVDEDLPVVNLVAFQPVTLYHRKVRGHTVGANGVNDSFADLWLER